MAFPTTGLLDAFTRADAPTLGANWTGPVVAGDARHGIVSNQCDTTANDTSDYYNPATYGPDTEAFMVLATIGTGYLALYTRIAPVDPDGYLLQYNTQAAAAYRYFILDNGAYTQLGADITTPTLSNGDQLGFEITGTTTTTLTGYTKQGAGAWTALATRSNNTYQAAGNIGIQSGGDTTGRMDDFSGGTVVVAGGATWPGWVSNKGGWF